MTSRSSCVIRHGKFGCSTSEMGLGRSLIPGLVVKLSVNILAGLKVLSAVGACPPRDSVR
jgi:hypothetical protein